MSASSDQDSASMGQKSRRAVRPDTASDVRPSVRSNDMRLFVIGYKESEFRSPSEACKGTDNVGIILGQNLIVLLQNLLKVGVVRSLGLFNKPHESHNAFVVLAEPLDEPLNAFISGLLVACP